MSDNNVNITFWAKLKNEVSAGFKRMVNGVVAGSKNIAGIFGALGGTASELSGKMGKLAAGIKNVYGAFAMLGPIGAVLAGLNAGINMIGDAIKRAYDRWVRFLQMRAEGISALLSDLKKHLFDIGDAALKKATTEAERAAKAFDALANAYLKVAKAKDATAKAGDDAAIAGMRRDKATAMNAAGGSEAAAIAGADWDVKIAQAQLDAAKRETEAAAQRSRDEEYQNGIRLDAAKANEEAAKIALEQAKKDEEFLRDVTNLEEEHQHALQNLALAEKTMADAINARVTAQANLEASGEAVKQSQFAMAAKLADAAAAVENATRQRRELLEAQKKAQETARKREEEEARKKADAEAKDRQRREYARMQREAQARLSGTQSGVNAAQRQADASQRRADTAWGWYRSADAWRNQRQEEQDEAKAQRQFAKDFERLQKRQDWRTAKLGDKDELVRRVALAREQAEFDKERLRVMQADLASAKDALDKIKTAIENGVEL